MQKLSDDARSMLDLVRGADDPSQSDRVRLRRAMVARLGSAAVIASSTKLAAASGTAAVTATGGLLTAAKWAIGLTILSIAGVSAMAGHRGPPRLAGGPVVARSAQASRQAAAVAPLGTERAATLAEPSVAPTAASIDAPSTSSMPLARQLASKAKHHEHTAAEARAGIASTPDELAEEVRVLGTARAQLREGHAERALALLDAEAPRFARSALREEFLAARILALRELGRERDARASAAEFARELPGSALLPKVIATEPSR